MAAQEEDSVLGDRVAALDHTGIPAIADRLLPLRRQLAVWAAATGMAADQIDAMILAADEAMSNAVSHAYDGDSPGTFDVHATHDADRNEIHVTIRDHGRWQPADPDPGPLHGRGLLLIRALADEATVDHTATGTVVRMTWRLA